MKIAWKILAGIAILACIGLLIAEPTLTASNDVAQTAMVGSSEVVTPHLSQPVRDLQPADSEPVLDREINPIKNPGLFMEDMGLPGSNTTSLDPLAALSRLETGRTPAPLFTFEGLGTDGFAPPDTIGEVGPNHYVQMVNISFAVFDKSGNQLTAKIPFNALFAGAGGVCQNNNDGDPVVVYDSLADRWLLSQFALPSGQESMCIAISQTPDPTGAFYTYEFLMPDFPDYFKFGIWPDAYYMSTNTGFPNQYYAYAFDRQNMLLGQPATFQYSNGHPNFMMPADLDGTNPPPPGSPGYFYTMLAQGYPNHPAGVDRIALYEFDVDWATPANSSFTLAQEIPIADYNYTVCGFFVGNCIPQPGTANGIDSLSYWPMWRFQYRNLLSYEALVGNFTVDVDGTDYAGIRWFELRKNAVPTWSLHQEGTQAPDSDHRFMGSIAMDGSGNIALGYSVSGPSTFPSIRYATRLVTDPPGTMQAEETLYPGGGSQTSITRWGDYSSLNVDPADECTFWYTNEYHDVSDGGFNWNTRVGVFRIPSCTGTLGASGTLEGNVTDAGSSSPLSGVSINATNGFTQTGSATTNAAGDYSMTLLVGTYTVTASAFGYLPSTVSSVSVMSGTMTVQDFALTAAPSYTISGTVTNVDHGWPVYASIAIPGYPGGTIWTDPLTGFYSVTLPGGATYTLNVSAVNHQTASIAVGPLSADTTQNVALSPDFSQGCTPGYQESGVIYHDGFETGVLGPEWSVITTNEGRVRVSTSDPYAGSYSVLLDDSIDGGLTSIAAIALTQDLSAQTQVYLDFWWHEYGDENNPEDGVFISDNNGVTWCNVLSFNNGPSAYRNDVIDLTAALTTCSMSFNSGFRIKFQGYDNFAIPTDGYTVDEIKLKTTQTTSCSPVPSGRIVGYTSDDNTSALLAGVTVETDSGQVALSDAGGYYEFIESPGTVVMTATLAGGYLPDVETPTIVQGSAIQQDFALPAGWIVPSQTAFNPSVQLGTIMTVPLTLTNSGAVAANFEIGERDKGFAPFLTAQSPFGFGITGSGGPDLFGYTYKDSDEPDGPTYSWVDISATGTPVFLADDNSDGPFPTGFPFNFYGVDQTEFFIGSNGFLSFGGGSSSLSNQCPLPSTSTPNDLISLMWDDLDPGDTSDAVYYETFASCPYGGGACLVVQFENYHHFPGGGTIAGTFEAILFESGSVLIQYEDAGAEEGLSSTTGIEGPGGTDGLGYGACNTAAHLKDSLAVCFAYPGESADCTPADVPWLSSAPITGTIGSGSNAAVNLTFDATTVTQPGNYLADLLVNSDTPYGRSTIPITMTVTAPANFGLLEGTVSSTGYCDANPFAADGAQVDIEASTGMTWTLTADPAGFYSLYLDQATSPITVTASASEHQTVVMPGITVTGQQTTTVDFDLRWLQPCVSADTNSLAATVNLGQSTTIKMDLENIGGLDAFFSLREADGGSAPILGPALPNAGAAASTAQPVLPVVTSAAQCSLYENYAGIEPVGYAKYCMADVSLPAVAAGSGRGPTDMAFAHDIGFVSDNVVEFALNDFPNQTILSTNSQAIFGYDYDPSATVLYAIENTAQQLGTFDTATGTFTAIGPSIPPAGHTWSGLTIDPVDGTFYASSTNGTLSQLHTLDPATGTPTLVGNITGLTLVIDIAMNTNGELYAHDIGADAIYQLDPATGAPTLVGPTGYNGNFAQGMDFDNDDGTLYIFLYIGGGANVYGTVDLSTGAVTPLAVDNPQGEFEGAVRTVGLIDVPWLSENPVTGTIAADGGIVSVDVLMDASQVTQAGNYYATLKIASNDPMYPLISIPVTMTVNAPASFGKLDGTVSSLGYCDTNPFPADGADVFIESSTGSTFNLTADASGMYSIWLDSAENPYTMTVSAAAHQSAMASLSITAQMTTTQDFGLRWLEPCVTVAPPSFDVQLGLGTTATLPLAILNDGAGMAQFSLSEQNIGYAASLNPTTAAGSTPVTINPRTYAVADITEAGAAAADPVIGRASGGPAPEDIGTAWETMAPLPAGRVFNAVVADGNGYVYVIGGTSDAGGVTATNTNYRYNTATNSWTTMATMPSALSQIDGIVVGNKIYIPGDDTNSGATYVYDIASDSWSTIAANGGYTGRVQYQVVAIGTDVYVLGGISAGASTTQVWVLDTTSGTWSAGTPMQRSRTSFSAAAMNGSIYVAGGVAFPGFTPDMTTEVFNGSSWSLVANVPNGGGAYTRWSYNADGLGADGLWLGAGRRDAAWSILNHAGYYDPLTNVWTDSPTIPTLTQGRVYMEGDVATDGYFYVIGGRDSAGATIYATNERLEVGYAGGGGGDIPWLSASPITGTVSADGMYTVDLVFDATAITQTGVYSGVLTVSTNDPMNGTIDVPVRMTVSAPTAAIDLAVTLSTDGSCGATDTLTVDYGTVVYYCYTVTNTGNVMLPNHTISDTVFGHIDTFLYDLQPGLSESVIYAQTMTQNAASTATWTASHMGLGLSAAASDGATVTLNTFYRYLPVIFSAP